MDVKKLACGIAALAVVAGNGVVSGQAQTPSKEEEILPAAKEIEKLQALTPAGVQQTVVTRDDDLETVATLSTEKAYRNSGRFTDRVRSDNFLRAFIDKRTGATRFQVYQEISYNFVYREFTTVNFATPDGPVSAKVDEIAHEIPACFAGGCSYKDSLGFIVDEAVLREIAAQYVTGNSPFWRFRFRGRAGIDWNDRMMPAEVAGLLAAVDAYRAAHSR